MCPGVGIKVRGVRTDAKSCPGKEGTPGAARAGECLALRETSRCPVEGKLGVSHRPVPRLHGGMCGQQIEGRAYPPQCSLDPPGQERHQAEQSSMDHPDGWELGHLLAEEMLRELVLVSLQKSQLQPSAAIPLMAAFSDLQGGHQEDGARLFTAVHGGRTGGGHMMKQERFRLDMVLKLFSNLSNPIILSYQFKKKNKSPQGSPEKLGNRSAPDWIKP